jgi:2-dehydro-3-deoxyphosphooctonate aldolase (KDO 8-P synthase)
MAPVLARAAVAAGADGLFLEVHPDPPRAASDAAVVLPLRGLKDLLHKCQEIRWIARS